MPRGDRLRRQRKLGEVCALAVEDDVRHGELLHAGDPQALQLERGVEDGAGRHRQHVPGIAVGEVGALRARVGPGAPPQELGQRPQRAEDRAERRIGDVGERLGAERQPAVLRHHPRHLVQGAGQVGGGFHLASVAPPRLVLTERLR